MACTNAFVEIRMGNVEATLVGPIPLQALDRAVNPGLAPGAAPDGSVRARALVFDGARRTFLVGALPQVKRTLRRHGIRFRIRPRPTASPGAHRWSLQPQFILRGYQEEVVNEAVRRGRGLIDIGTGGGKTLLAAAIIARLGLPALYLVTTRTLLEQTVRLLSAYLGTTPGIIGAGTCAPGPLTVALVQALDPSRIDISPWHDGTVVFDEGHHAAAPTYLDLITRLSPGHAYFLTAVPYRTGEDQLVFDALAGSSLTAGRYSARYLIERGYAAPVEVRVEHCIITGDMTEKPFGSLYREFIVDNAVRNRQVAGIAQAELDRGSSVLILVDHIRHGHHLLDLVGSRARFVCGEASKADLRDSVCRFSAGDLRCLIATAGLFQEGVSIEGIQVLVQAGGLKSRVKVLQSIGRGMRLAPGKAACLYVDFWDDDTAGILRAHSAQRLAVLREEGFPLTFARAASRSPELDQPIPSSWSHVPRTRRFLLISAQGHIEARAECIDRSCVPERFCARCKGPRACEYGGRIVLWHDDRG